MTAYESTLGNLLEFAREAGSAVRNVQSLQDKLRMRRLEKAMYDAARIMREAQFEFQDAEAVNVRGRRAPVAVRG